ncbi:hypothetical protein, partial [Cronobacter sakazakii]|uniref:hypothetical protein n=1 Tax=Cronobacter sakazakii TaxID=28141 RepID=UPI001F39A587
FLSPCKFPAMDCVVLIEAFWFIALRNKRNNIFLKCSCNNFTLHNSKQWYLALNTHQNRTHLKSKYRPGQGR